MKKSASGASGAFKVGDVVRLKSGGPKMTVQSVDKSTYEDPIDCTWFSETECEYKSDTFSPEILDHCLP